uniref:Fibronectin type-III domain-containing protein n=1 Tax=Monopterus albus TaxID=43700 RepID=A0A3Q3QEE2_MONAL
MCSLFHHNVPTFSVAGLDIPQPDKMMVTMLDEEVIVHWKHPVGAPQDSQYNVQMGKLNGEWVSVGSCTGTTNTYCDLSSLISADYRSAYKVKVQLVAGDKVSQWTAKKFLLTESELQPPSFNLWATSSTLSVYVHQKPILRELFPYGLTYTVYLEEREQDKNITEFLKDDMQEDQRLKTFTSLQWGTEYCISIKVEGSGALHQSRLSPKQCLRLPDQEWFIIAVSSLSVAGVLFIIAIIAAILHCYLRRPEKTPAVLKNPVSGWLPVSVEQGTIEVVTDKGWFLSSYTTDMKNCVKDPMAHVTVTEDNGEEDRRTSMDSGISMKSNAATDNGGSPLMRQEDSGCGSLGGPESSTGSQANYPLQDEGTDTKREDSGVGLGFQLDSSSMNLDEQDSRFLKDSVAGGSYRSQSPSAVQACDDEEMFKQMLPDTALAEVITGYRAGPQTCICSGAGQCTWCHKQGHYGPEVIKQYRALCIENGLLHSKCDFVDTYKAGLTLSSHCRKPQMDTVTVDDFEHTLIQQGETFPLLTALTPLPLMEGGQDFNMNNVSLSLCDVQLTID